MGTDETEYNNPKRTEKIEQPFLLGETEVTQELYEAVMGYNPSSDDDDAQKPVEYVTWYDAVMFCNKLSQLLGKTTYYQISNIKNLEENKIKTNNIESADVEINLNANGFRLPTEKEWEYAAKAWTNNKWAGCDIDDNLTEYASFDENSSETCPVQTRWPNEWGFYDMSGNVYEWCWDQYNSTSADRVTRGGSYFSDAPVLHSAFRYYNSHPGGRYLGFRVSVSL
jgi:formylglycine-generating enzyme required for sulfatase activity